MRTIGESKPNHLPRITVECRVNPKARIKTTIRCRETRMTSGLSRPANHFIKRRTPVINRDASRLHVGCMPIGQVGIHASVTNPRERMQDVGEHFQYRRKSKKTADYGAWRRGRKRKTQSINICCQCHQGTSVPLSIFQTPSSSPIDKWWDPQVSTLTFTVLSYIA